MTQRQFATVGILVIAVGLIITLGQPQLLKVKTTEKMKVPEVVQQTIPGTVDADRQQGPGKKQENETGTSVSVPVEPIEVVESREIAQDASSIVEQVRKEEVLSGSPQVAAPALSESVGKVAPQQVSAAAEPDWSFRPAHSVGKAFDCRIENPVFGKARIEHVDRGIRISFAWLPARCFFGLVPFCRGHVQITPGLRLAVLDPDAFRQYGTRGGC